MIDNFKERIKKIEENVGCIKHKRKFLLFPRWTKTKWAWLWFYTLTYELTLDWLTNEVGGCDIWIHWELIDIS